MSVKRMFGFFCMLLGGTLVFLSAAQWLTRYRMEEEAGKRSETLLLQMRQKADLPVSESTHENINDGMEGAAVPSMPLADGLTCIGMLSFPSLDLALPVLSSCSETLLETAPCRQYGTPQGEDLVIAGHNYRKHFKRLRELERGDRVEFSDADGNAYTYSVDRVEILLPTERNRMIDSPWPLTLYTCTAGGEKRFTVRCEAVS